MSPQANVKPSAVNDIPENQATKIPVQKEDIGGELLEILSKGLYTNPLDSIREYIQNAVDGQALRVKVKITGNSIWIHDDGDGMSLGELIQARRFAVSRKSIFENAGFRGIGIYSGFDLCNRLRITTKKKGDRAEYVLEFDFGAMKKLLDKERENPKGKRTSLEDLLYEYSVFYKRPQRKSTKFTFVTLEEISGVHISRFANRDELRKYILQNTPVDFDPKFQYRKQLDRSLRANVKGYNAVTVILQSDDKPDETIAKPAIPNLYAPRKGFITNSRGEQIAYFWACLNKERKTIADSNRKSPEIADYQGFAYKFKGFTIGNRSKLEQAFKKGRSTLYDWYTGEIYVLDHRVLPNAERDDFEESDAKQALRTAVYDKLKKLEAKADDQREIALADEELNEIKERIAAAQLEVKSRTYERGDTYTEVANLASDIVKRKKRILDLRKRKQKDVDQTSEDEKLIERARSIEKLADKLSKQCGTLQHQVRKDIDNPPGTKSRRKVPPAPPAVGDKPEPSDTTQKTKTIGDVLATAGWKLDENCAALVSILQQTLEGTLGVNSTQYTKVIEDLEDRIEQNFSE